jgi:hypothetical protein
MTIQELDDPTDDDDVTIHRERARTMLNQIAQQSRLALADAGIDTPCVPPRSQFGRRDLDCRQS